MSAKTSPILLTQCYLKLLNADTNTNTNREANANMKTLNVKSKSFWSYLAANFHLYRCNRIIIRLKVNLFTSYGGKTNYLTNIEQFVAFPQIFVLEIWQTFFSASISDSSSLSLSSGRLIYRIGELNFQIFSQFSQILGESPKSSKRWRLSRLNSIRHQQYDYNAV